MDWTKIKAQHFLFSPLSDAKLGLLARLLCLVATLERLPTDGELSKFCTKKQRESLELYYKSVGISLNFVMQKVVEDVEDVRRQRQQAKERKRKQRGLEKGDVTRDVTLQIREDKIREDNIIRKDPPPKGEGPPKNRFLKPTPQAVEEYARSINFKVSGNVFCDYYETRGWKLKGGTAMKDWQAAVRTWKNNESKEVRKHGSGRSKHLEGARPAAAQKRAGGD